MASALTRSRTFASLARWLGPWTPDAKAPVVETQQLTIDDRFPARLYRPRGRAIGAFAIAPGVHYAGPDDPRMDRFCRVLAASGIVTLAPWLPDFVAMRVAPTAIDDFARVFDALRPHSPVPRPGVFSISFGSLLALRLAATRPDELGGVVVFGGYADWDATIRFAATGEIDGKPWIAHDGRNLPVLFMNLLDDLPAPVVDAWTRYVRATWGRVEMREPSGWEPVARRFAEEVPAAHRELYLQGCGLAPGVIDVVDRELARRDLGYLDPRPHLASVRCPVWLVHGLTDDVIPWPQAEALKRALPAAAEPRVLLTGLYGHTSIEKAAAGAAQERGPGGRWYGLGGARELRTMMRIVSGIVDAATRGDRGA